jgi:DNA-binding NarL/FixJ family response regulator
MDRHIPDLTPREREVSALLAQGLSNAQIAEELHIAQSTVKDHVSRLFKKLGVTNRTQAALHALRSDPRASGE